MEDQTQSMTQEEQGQEWLAGTTDLLLHIYIYIYGPISNSYIINN